MLSSLTNHNHLNLYTLSGINLAIEILQRLLQLAKPTTELTDSFNDLNTKEDEEDPQKSYRLITKYYSAILNVKIIDVTKDNEDFSDPEIDNTQSNQVSIIVFDPTDSERLIDFLTTFGDLESELSMVIVSSSNEPDENLNQIQESCQEFGFEFYDSETLNEASMALQCVAWPKIKRYDRKPRALEAVLSEENGSDSHTSQAETSSELPVKSLSEIDWNKDITSFKSSKEVDLQNHMENQFEDDFSPFVSSDPTSSTSFNPFNPSDYDELQNEDEDPTEMEYQELNEYLFNSNSNQVRLDELDMGDLFTKLNSLKDLGSQMKDEDRKKLASQVALLIENKLES